MQIIASELLGNTFSRSRNQKQKQIWGFGAHNLAVEIA